MSKELDVNIPDVIEMVKVKGMTRDEIAEHYGISKKACREQIFSHPELKGIRKPQAKRAVVINLHGASEEDAPKGEKEEVAEESADAPIEETVSEGDKELPAETESETTEEDEVEEETEEEQNEEGDSKGTVEEEEEAIAEEEEEDKPSSGVEW